MSNDEREHREAIQRPATPKPPTPRPDEDLPKLGRSRETGPDDELPKLGSLAQSARVKELNTARNILIVIGILTILVNGIQIPMVRDQVHKAIQADLAKRGVIGFPPQAQQVEEIAVRVAYLVSGVTAVLGVIFLVFGFLVKAFPVPITITSLVLYVGAAVVFAALNPQSLAVVAVVIKIIIIVALAKAVQSALVYQREKRYEQLELGHE